MTYARHELIDDPKALPRMPSWVTSARPETPEDVAFLSGAALSYLHLVLSWDDVPQVLLRKRLALRAAEACAARSGRAERAGELRDAVAFLQPGDSPGPAGEVYLSWRRAIERPMSVKTLHRAMPDLEPELIVTWLDAGQGAPIARAAAVLQSVIADRPRDPAIALLLADVALAQALGWMLRTWPSYAAAIRAASDTWDQDFDLREYDVAVLAAIAYHQPVTRDGLKDILGKEISRDLIGRLHARGLIGTGPRAPRRGAPYTYVTTEQFLLAFDFESLQDLSDREQRQDAGLATESEPGRAETVWL